MKRAARSSAKDARRMAGLGLIFGLAACVSFCAFWPWIDRHFGNEREEVQIPRDEEEELQETEVEEDQDSEQESYRQMLNSLKSIAEQAQKSVVSIAAAPEQQGDTEQVERQTCGVIVADNGQELLGPGADAGESRTLGIFR